MKISCEASVCEGGGDSTVTWTIVRSEDDFPPEGQLVLGWHGIYGPVLCRWYYTDNESFRYWKGSSSNFLELLDEDNGPDLWMEIPDLPRGGMGDV